MFLKRLSVFLFFITNAAFSQTVFYPVSSIPDSLKTNADAVVRLEEIKVEVLSQKQMVYKKKQIVTVFNANGLGVLDNTEGYDNRTKINTQTAKIYNGAGIEIKKIKKDDFRDQAYLDGYTILSDSRIRYLYYTPTVYPFTISYESELQTSNTVGIPGWYPSKGYNTAIEKSTYTAVYPNNLGFKKLETNFSKLKINKITETETQLSYELTGVKPQKAERMSASYELIYPMLRVYLEKFHYEGLDGQGSNWKELGDWYYSKLIDGTTDLPEATKQKIRDLVGTEKDPIKIAKLVYQYVQSKTRYVSIQLGIGGWKPMLAADVDRLGYGDCKALSNYTRALLAVVGVESYNTIVYGGKSKQNVHPDFVSLAQGNHMILCLPTAKENIFLECTSQDNPFGFQANFTDDRTVLIVKPGASELVKTKVYEDKINTQISTGSYTILENGDLNGEVSIVSKGIQYENKSDVPKMLPNEQEAHYKSYWDYIENLKVTQVNFNNDKETIQFTEKVTLTATEYGKIVNGKMMLVLNVFNRNNETLPRIRNRKTAFEINRGYLDKDEVTVTVPKGFEIEFLPESVNITSKYGNYKLEISKIAPDKIKYTRTNQLNSGVYTNKEYDDFRTYKEQIAQNDNAKIVLTKKP